MTIFLVEIITREASNQTKIQRIGSTICEEGS